MSEYSEAWANADPKVRDFFRNYADRYTRHTWHAEWWEEYQMWLDFYTFGTSFVGRLGWHIFAKNMTMQKITSGSFNPNVCLFTLEPNWTPPDIQPSTTIYPDGELPDQFEVIPIYAINYPRLKYKIRKSYWTGAPRRRRNRMPSP